MSSKIKVDTIENVAGSGNVSLGSGHNLVVPGNTTVTGSVITSTGFSVGNTAVLGQEIDVSSGDFTLDVAGDITLDADGGQINLNDGGTNVGKIILNSNQDLLISSRVSDKDVVFSGNDGGSMTEFMRIDSSLGGVITTPGRPAFLAYGSPSVDSLSGSYGHIHSFGNADVVVIVMMLEIITPIVLVDLLLQLLENIIFTEVYTEDKTTLVVLNRCWVLVKIMIIP